jgi:hypothetical protein
MRDLEASVRDAISRYVADSISVDELAGRLPDAWDVDEAGEEETTELVLFVVGQITEYELGRQSEQELRSALKGEASWLVDREFVATDDPVTTPEFETRVRSGAGTEPQKVLVS